MRNVIFQKYLHSEVFAQILAKVARHGNEEHVRPKQDKYKRRTDHRDKSAESAAHTFFLSSHKGTINLKSHKNTTFGGGRQILSYKFPPHRRYSLDAEGAALPLPRPLIVGQVFLLLFYVPLSNAVILFFRGLILALAPRVRPPDQYLSRAFFFAYCGDQRSALCGV